MSKARRIAAAAAVSALLLALGGPAHAADASAHEKILFTRAICADDDLPCWEIVVANPDDTDEVVVAGPYPRVVWDDHFIANWAPDGRSLIFMADLGDGQAIWQVDADGADLHAVFRAPPGGGLDDGPAFTPDGRQIVFTRCCPRPGGYGLWRIDADGSKLRHVTTEVVPPFVDGPSDNLPEVSPDGRTIAFHRNLNSCGCYVATVNIAGGRLRAMTDVGFDGQIPNWSPDGRRIAFQSLGNVWAVGADGGDLTQLTFDGGGAVSVNPSYSPDGSKIIFGHNDAGGNRDLYTMNPDGSGVTRISSTPGIERFPHWVAVP